ncbi:unnamed protein product [Colias eurytheme]|nr:unnamed protein product [Colias eurytheme]
MKSDSRGIIVRGEPFYQNDTGSRRSITKPGKYASDISPNPITTRPKIKKLKIDDVDKLLAKHFGKDWMQREDLDYYKTVIDCHRNNANNINVDDDEEFPANQVSELIEENRTTSGDSLQPTITDLIPEKEMDILRKSLEEDKEEDTGTIHTPDILNNKKSKRNLIKKCYVDFISDEEDFVWDSTSWKDTDETSSEDGEPKKRKKKIINKKQARKDAKSKGKEYTNKSGTTVQEKQMQTNPCLDKNCPYKCGEVEEEKRVKIFEYFWQLSNQRKKDWLVAISSYSEVKKKEEK